MLVRTGRLSHKHDTMHHKLTLIARIMKENEMFLNSRVLRRFFAYLDSDHRSPIKNSVDQADAIFNAKLATLSDTSIAIDCGANVGEISERIAATGATLFCFEPDDILLPDLIKRLVPYPAASVFPAAVSTNSGTAKLYKSPLYHEDPTKYSQRNSIRSAALTRDETDAWMGMDTANTSEVEMINLISFIEGVLGMYGRLDLLKIDIEGAEVEILEELDHKNLLDSIGLTIAELHEARFPDELSRISALRSRLSQRYPSDKVNLDWR